MLKNLGQRIRNIRKEKGLTLIEVSEKTGIAQATLSRIETGTMSGTVESHERIAEVLGIGLPELYLGVDKRYDQISHLTHEAERKITHHSNHVHVELLTSESSKKKITPYLITLQPNGKTQSEHQERGVEKFFFLIEGNVTAKVQDTEYILKSGETLYFDASLPHHLVNEGPKTAKILAAVSPSKL